MSKRRVLANHGAALRGHVVAAFAFAAALLVGAGQASAEPPARGAIQRRATQYARDHNGHGAVGNRVKTLARNRPVITIKNAQAAERYCNAFKNDSVEIIFRPGASEWGHIHLRAGDKVYDLGAARFARADKLHQAGAVLRGDSYGFVFGLDPRVVNQLKTTLEDKVRRAKTGELRFSYKPWQERGDSCETFIARTLREVAPMLGVYQSGFRGATGLGKWGLKSDKLEAVTIYSPRDIAAGDSFSFKKLD